MKIVQCRRTIYYPGGTETSSEMTCALHVNTVNEVAFVALWFSYVGLLVIAVTLALFRLATILGSPLRK